MQNYNSGIWGFGGILLGSVKVKTLSILLLFLLLGYALSTQDLGAKIDLEMKGAAASETQMFAGRWAASRARRKKSGPTKKLDSLRAVHSLGRKQISCFCFRSNEIS